ncbi:MAG: DUF948 domain-containing protein [Proteobacteria bacterium]|nr:DUF948 domain-containing protein [Pseudomonadota bacterium]
MPLTAIALIVIAVALCILVLALIPTFLTIKRTAATVGELAEMLQSELKPALRELTGVLAELNTIGSGVAEYNDDVKRFMSELGAAGILSRYRKGLIYCEGDKASTARKRKGALNRRNSMWHHTGGHSEAGLQIVGGINDVNDEAIGEKIGNKAHGSSHRGRTRKHLYRPLVCDALDTVREIFKPVE